VETEVELRDGQSFAIAGLLNQNDSDDKAGVPGLSKIPLLGYLFQSRRKSNARSELLVLVTPKLVQPLKAETALAAAPKDGGVP
jgi:pilus assembly protein CpaC